METGCGHEGDCVRTSAEAVFEFLSRQADRAAYVKGNNDTATFEVLIAHAVPDLVTNVLILVGTGILLFVINPLLAALTLIPIPFLVLGSGIFTKKVLPNFREAQGNLGILTQWCRTIFRVSRKFRLSTNSQGRKNALKKGQENTLPQYFMLSDTHHTQ